MKKIVLFLGAGASKAFRYPLTGEILGLIITDLKNEMFFNNAGVPRERAALYRLMLQTLFTKLSPGLGRYLSRQKALPVEGEDGLPLITDLLSQAKHLVNNSQTLLDWNHEVRHPLLEIRGLNERWELKDIIVLLDWAIIDLINKAGKYTKDKLDPFVRWMRRVNASKSAFVSIVTTNFDFSVEWNLFNSADVIQAHKRIDYGFNWRDVGEKGDIYPRPAEPRLRVFKLHGSIDWLKCERCGHVYINPLYDIYNLAFSNKKKTPIPVIAISGR